MRNLNSQSLEGVVKPWKCKLCNDRETPFWVQIPWDAGFGLSAQVYLQMWCVIAAFLFIQVCTINMTNLKSPLNNSQRGIGLWML